MVPSSGELSIVRVPPTSSMFGDDSLVVVRPSAPADTPPNPRSLPSRFAGDARQRYALRLRTRCSSQPSTLAPNCALRPTNSATRSP